MLGKNHNGVNISPVNIHHRANVGFSAAGLGESWKNCQHSHGTTNSADEKLRFCLFYVVALSTKVEKMQLIYAKKMLFCHYFICLVKFVFTAV